jgi:hypothetical protein
MMRFHQNKNILCTFLLVIFAAACSTASTMEKSPASAPVSSATTAPPAQASPPGTAELDLGGKKISIRYNRPSMRGRKIMGDLVPYGRIWRTGANQATSLTTDADLMIGNVAVPKGSYTLYTLPSASEWKLIINKQTGQWGTNYDEKMDLGRVEMKVEKTAAPVEQFTISLVKADQGGVLKLEWENTSASVTVTAK